MSKVKKLLLAVLLIGGVATVFVVQNSDLLQGKLLNRGAALSTSSQLASICNYVNESKFLDEKNDVSVNGITPAYPGYVDIRSLTVRQLAQDVQFVWEGGADLFNTKRQYYFILLDTDENQNTGREGAEIILSVEATATLNYFDANGDIISTEHDIPVIFEGKKFYLNIPISKINSHGFRVVAQTHGDSPYYDELGGGNFSIANNRTTLDVTIGTDNPVIVADPFLANIETKNSTIPLKTYVSINRGQKIQVPINSVKYSVDHATAISGLPAPSSIVSVDSQGRAKYLSEGFVMVSPKIGNCYFPSRNIIATGDVVENENSRNTVSVFPLEFTPQDSSYSYGDVMDENPDFAHVVETIYIIESQIYKGYVPRNEKQILSLINDANSCGGNGNPLKVASRCTFDFNSGVPNYGVIAHEMGHNFAENKGASTMLGAQDNAIGKVGFGECVASLPAQYIRQKFYDDPQNYGISTDSYAYTDFAGFQIPDNQDNLNRLHIFESYIEDGKIDGLFDFNSGSLTDDEKNMIGGDVGAFCSLFVPAAAYPELYDNSYGWEFYPRFLGLFNDRDLPNFEPDKVKTYFAAAYSAAIGQDMREKMRFWGFEIDDEYFDEMYGIFEEELN